MSTPLSPDRVAAYAKAVRHLSRRDPVLKELIRRVGPCTMQPASDDPFTVLVRCVVYQQISTKAATTIFNRLADRLGGVPVCRIKLAAATADELRACGISGPKQRTFRAILDHLTSDPEFLGRVPALADDDLRAEVTRIKGFGPWSADMMMMFGLGRLDVLPVGDLGLKMGVQEVYGLGAMPSAAELAERAEPWRPYRSVATWYFWRSRGPVPQSGQGG